MTNNKMNEALTLHKETEALSKILEIKKAKLYSIFKSFTEEEAKEFLIKSYIPNKKIERIIKKELQK